MSVLTAVNRAVVAGLESKTIGTPVAVRAFLRLSADHGHLMQIATEMALVAATWFEADGKNGASPQETGQQTHSRTGGGHSRAVRVHAHGGSESGQLVLLTEHRGGQTTLITVGTLHGEAAPMVDLLVIGNHGTIYWDGAANSSIDVQGYEPEDLSRAGQVIRAAIERSIRTGDSVPVESDR